MVVTMISSVFVMTYDHSGAMMLKKSSKLNKSTQLAEMGRPVICNPYFRAICLSSHKVIRDSLSLMECMFKLAFSTQEIF